MQQIQDLVLDEMGSRPTGYRPSGRFPIKIRSAALDYNDYKECYKSKKRKKGKQRGN